MKKDTWIIPRSKLEDWLHSLNREVSIAGDGIDYVKRQIKGILWEMDNVPDYGKELTMKEIQVGKIYQIRPLPTVKQYLHYISVKVTDKKRKNVIGELQQSTNGWSIGTRFTIPANILQEL